MGKRYSSEMKTEIVKLSNSVGCAEAARRLNMTPKTIHNMRFRNPELCVPLPHGRKKLASPEIEFTPAVPKEKKTGVLNEEVVIRVFREKRKQYGDDVKKQALILSDMVGCAEAARRTEVKVGTIRGWLQRRKTKAKWDALIRENESLKSEVSLLKSAMKKILAK